METEAATEAPATTENYQKYIYDSMWDFFLHCFEKETRHVHKRENYDLIFDMNQFTLDKADGVKRDPGSTVSGSFVLKLKGEGATGYVQDKGSAQQARFCYTINDLADVFPQTCHIKDHRGQALPNKVTIFP